LPTARNRAGNRVRNVELQRFTPADGDLRPDGYAPAVAAYGAVISMIAQYNAPAIGTIPARKQQNPDLGKRALEPDRQIVWRPGSPVSHLLNVCVCHTGRPYPYQGSCRARPPDPAQTITGEENARVNDTRRRDTHERTLI